MKRLLLALARLALSAAAAAQEQRGSIEGTRERIGRTSSRWVDLLVQQEFRLPGDLRVIVGVNAINLFDQKTVVQYNTTPFRDGFNVSDATFFAGFDPVAVATAQSFRRDASLGMASGCQDFRVVRLQAKLTF